MAKKGGVFRAVYGVFFALLTLFVGALFIRQVWSVYRSSPTSPYTVENISKHFQEIALPVWIWVGGLGVNILLSFLLPDKKKKPVKATVDEKKALQRVKGRVPVEGEYYEKAYALSKKQTAFRAAVGVIATLFMLAAATLCVLTLLDIFYRPVIKKTFFQEHNGVVDRICQTAALSIAALVVGAIAAGLLSVSRKKEKNGHLSLIVDSRRVAPPATESVAETESTAEVVEAPSLQNEEDAVTPAGEGEKISPWAGVIRSIIGAQCLGEVKSEAEIHEEIYAVLKGLEEKSDTAAVTIALPEELPLEETLETVVEGQSTEEQPKKKNKPLVKPKKAKKAHPKARKAGVIALRVALAAAGVALVAIGVFNGGMRDVLMKAINICTQCIGLG